MKRPGAINCGDLTEMSRSIASSLVFLGFASNLHDCLKAILLNFGEIWMHAHCNMCQGEGNTKRPP